MNIEAVRPRLAIRCTSYFGWMIAFFVLFTYLAFREHLPLNPFLLIIFSLVGIGLAIPGALQVLKLKHKKESIWVSSLGTVAAMAGIITLLELKTRGIFIWNELYFVVPILLFMLIVYGACFIAEDQNHIKVYLALDGLHYVQA